MYDTNREYHPRWKKNFDEMNTYMVKRSLKGKHITGCKGNRLFCFQLGEPKRYEYVIIHKKNPLKKDMLTCDYLCVFETKKFTVYRREEPLVLWTFEESVNAKKGDAVLLANPFSDSQDEEFEDWLSERAKEGLIFLRDDACGCVFLKGKPENSILRTDYRIKIQDFSEYLSDITGRGWKYVWSNGSSFYFKKTGSDIETEQLLYNNTSKIEKYKRKIESLKKPIVMLELLLAIGAFLILGAILMLIFPHGIIHGTDGKPDFLKIVLTIVLGIVDCTVSVISLKFFKEAKNDLQTKIDIINNVV